jgi:iron(III) transport system permease protein
LLAIVPPLWGPLQELLLEQQPDAANPLAQSRIWALFGRSLWRSFAVTLVCLLLGTPLGFLLARTDVWGRNLARPLHLLPLFLPPYLLALGWFFALREAQASQLLFGELGAIAISVMAFTPIVSSFASMAYLGMDPSQEEVGLSMASRFPVLVRVLLPATLPIALIACLVVFSLSFSELGVPLFLRVEAYPAAVFARLGGLQQQPGEALLLSLPVVPVAVALLIWEKFLRRRRSFASLALRRTQPAWPLGRLRWPCTVLVWGIVLVPLVPFATFFLRALQGGGFAEVPRWLGSSLATSLGTGVFVATLATAVAVVLGHALARNSRLARWLDTLAVLTFLLPAGLLASGFLTAWNRPGTQFLYQSLGLLALAYLARYCILPLRAIAAHVAQTSVHLEESAEALGARYPRLLSDIVVPMHRRSIVLGWLLTLIFCLRDLGCSMLLYPAGREPLIVRIFTLEANGPEAVIAGLACVQVLLTMLLLMLGILFLRQRKHGP